MSAGEIRIVHRYTLPDGSDLPALSPETAEALDATYAEIARRVEEAVLRSLMSRAQSFELQGEKIQGLIDSADIPAMRRALQDMADAYDRKRTS